MSERHAENVLAAIIPARADLLDKALMQLTENHFSDPTHRVLFQMLERYASVTGEVLRRDALVDGLRDVPAARVALITETYDALVEQSSDEADFRWSVLELRQRAAEKATGEALAEAQTILTSGLTVGYEELQGQADARARLLDRITSIDKELSLQDSPEGVLQNERQELLDDYEERKKLRLLGKGEGIRFGIPSLDEKTGGFHNGELNLVAGSSSSGKSSACVQLAWHAAVRQGKNVVFATTETLRPQIIRKLVARHAKLEQFGLPHGLNTKDLKAGTLTETEEIKRVEVINDLTTNPMHGKIYIMQVPRGASLSVIEAKTTHINASQFHVDLVVIDYLGLLHPGRARESERVELKNILKEAKQFATTFDDGRGVPVVSPWQTNREGQANASKAGAYSQAALAETAEAVNSSDVIISIHSTDSTQRYADLKAQVLKNRDGETSEPMPLTVDYATCYFSERSVARMNVRNTTDADTGWDVSTLLG